VNPNMERAFLPDSKAISRVTRELAARLSIQRLAQEIQVSETQLKGLIEGKDALGQDVIWKLVGSAVKFGLLDILPANGMPSVPYDIGTRLSLERPPAGFGLPAPIVPISNRPTRIAGHLVDFPIGLAASALTANSNGIEFSARRGFDILTYKTVRTEFRAEHPWPNWVFLKDAPVIGKTDSSKFTGCSGYWPETSASVSMANSFGIPSFAPEWWTKEVERARNVVREGHQVLIVSVVTSKVESETAWIRDFVEVATRAKRAGADIVEANYSCPNTPDDRSVGDLYRSAETSARVSRAIKAELGTTPLFVKIGYLPELELAQFVDKNKEYVEGIVAINTIQAQIIDDVGKPTFHGSGRELAGVSGLAVRQRAHEVARNLVHLRNKLAPQLRRKLEIIGVGGVLTADDALYYLDSIGVDAVESCTGAYINPNLALETRLDRTAADEARSPGRVANPDRRVATR